MANDIARIFTAWSIDSVVYNLGNCNNKKRRYIMPGIGISAGAIGLGRRRGAGGLTAPDSLVVTVESDTLISATVTNNAASIDGYSWEYSTDGVNYSEHGTSLTNEYDYDSLTAGIAYFFRVRVYLGVNYSEYSNIAGASCTVIATSDSFTGATIDTAKWDETDPNSRISQNGMIFLSADHSANISEFVNNLVSIQSITSGVAVVQGYLYWDNNGTAEALGGIYLYKDANNFASITSRTTPGGGGVFRLRITIGGVAAYSSNTAFQQLAHVKIWTDGTDIKFYVGFGYWRDINAWEQMGSTQTFSLGYPLLYCMTFVDATTFNGANPIKIDHAFFSKQNYSTKYPDLEILLKKSAYCWFTTPTAVYNSDKTFIGVVHDSGGGYTQHIATLVNSTGAITVTSMGSVVAQDDHNEPSVLIRASDNKLFIAYAEHNTSVNIRHRISTNALDASAWGDEAVFEAPTNVSYASSFQVSNGDIYIFYREATAGYCYIKSSDGGVTFSGRTAFFFGFSTRGYALFRQSLLNPNIIHFVISSVHPQETAEASVYAFYFDCSDDKFYKLDGTETTANIPFDNASDLTLIMQNTAPDNGWIEDIIIDSTGKPRYLITFYPNGDNVDWLTKDLYYAEWNGTSVTTPHKIHTAAARNIGGATAPTYMPNSCFDVNNPEIIIASKDTNGVLELYKILRIASDNFLSVQLTKNSLIDLWRPFTIPAPQRNLFFLEKTTYTSYMDFTQQLTVKTI